MIAFKQFGFLQLKMMLDSVYGEAVSDLDDRTTTNWQHGLRAVADVNWTLCLRHPWVQHAYRFGLDRLIDGVAALIMRGCVAP